MTIKVIGAGFGRTGTTSLKAALEELGFAPCYHMQEVFKNPPHAPFWERAAAAWRNGTSVGEWEQVFGKYGATVDWPGCTFYQELMDVYPEAKVVLSVRDPERWYASTRETIYRVRSSLLLRILKHIPHIGIAYRMVDILVWQGTFTDRFEDRQFAIHTFNQHNEAVQAFVPPERLLVFDVKQGWEPLCQFLEVPIPNSPFPHLNDKKRMQRAMRYGPAILFSVALALITIIAWAIRLALT